MDSYTLRVEELARSFVVNILSEYGFKDVVAFGMHGDRDDEFYLAAKHKDKEKMSWILNNQYYDSRGIDIGCSVVDGVMIPIQVKVSCNNPVGDKYVVFGDFPCESLVGCWVELGFLLVKECGDGVVVWFLEFTPRCGSDIKSSGGVV